MKIKSLKKVVVSTMAIAMGAALAGSISGTVAWYQYSTRTTVAYVGASTHATHSLEMSLDGSNWKSDFTSAELISAAAVNGSKFQPVTPGQNITPTSATGNDNLPFPANPKKNPNAKHFAYSEWEEAEANSYIQFDLYFRVLDVDGAEATHENYLQKDVYLTDITIEGHITDPSHPENAVQASDFRKAIRIQFADVTDAGNKTYRTFADGVTATNLYGSLDLDNNPGADTVGRYEWDELDDSGNKVVGIYGADYDSASHSFDDDTKYVERTLDWNAYKADDTSSALVVGSAEKLGTTVADADGADQLPLHYTVTIWMEGWAELGSTPSALWDVADMIGDFHIGLSFGIEAHASH